MRFVIQRVVVGATLVVSQLAHGQAVPATQPGFLLINREEVKPGRVADHAKWEVGWPAAYERAKSPDAYLALVSMTGVPEVLYVGSYASHAAYGESVKRDDANPVLSAELDRLSKGDSEFLNSISTMHAIARTDLGVGAFPDIARMRFWTISTFRIRSGQEAAFEAAAKAYMAAAKRAVPSTSIRAYEVVAGAPGATYLFFGSVPSFADFDKDVANTPAIMGAATQAEAAALEKGSAAIMSQISQRYRLDPGQSFVSKETRATDPAFWMPKKPAAKP